MTPVEASKNENKITVHENLYPTDQSILKNVQKKIGDKVRIVKYKSIFDKGYLPNWTTETFIINQVFKTDPITYEIKDLSDEIIKGKFYDEEIVLFDKRDSTFKVEKILKRRTNNGVREVLIKWYGYPEKFNSWEPEANFVLK